MARSARTPFLGSLAIHLVVMLMLMALRHGSGRPQSASSAATAVPPVVYIPVFGRGGGGGGGGESNPAPVRRAEARGADDRSVPVAEPHQRSLAPTPVRTDVDVPVLSAVPAFAATQITHGLIDPHLLAGSSAGAGRDHGAGTGDGGGAGPDNGRGVGPGSQRGVGDGVHSVGSGVMPPVPVLRARPQYTTAAMTARLSGAAVVECVVTREGTVRDARIVRSLDARHGLDEEAIKAARQWRFRPGTIGGRPVAVRITIELVFSIY